MRQLVLVLLVTCLVLPVFSGLSPIRFLHHLSKHSETDTVSTTSSPNANDACNVAKNLTSMEVCDYVQNNDDTCEGGGYLLWSQYVECADNTAIKVVLIVVGVIYMLFLFLVISTVADDFFSPNVAVIVAHLKISESVAGVTFMAFGNGAPDIFGAIASVLSSKTPKAGLALGELLGAGIFVTTMVTATIVLTSPFKVDPYSTVRDLLFYLVALGWILFVFLYKDQVEIWEPAVYLGLYAVYVATVVILQHLETKRRKRKRAASRASRALSRRSTMKSRVTINNNAISITDAVEKLENVAETTEHGEIQNGSVVEHPAHLTKLPKRSSLANGGLSTKRSSMAYPSASRRGTVTIFPPVELLGAFGDIDEEEDDEDVIVIHNKVYVGDEARSRAASMAPPPIEVNSYQTFVWDLWMHLKPLADGNWEEANIFQKIIAVLNIGPIFAFKLTVPSAEASWSKAAAVVHAILAPQLLLIAIQMVWFVPISGGPGLCVYMIIPSAILVVLILMFTHQEPEPKYYKELYSYLGFFMSMTWMYFVANEVVNVVTMIGVVSRVSHEVLGLTILAWSNSIGDLIADISVVKQGFPRMAIAASIGGPLFNLLAGFGIPFLIATAQGKPVSIEFSAVYKVLLLFLAISIVFTLVAIFVQRLFLRRPYALMLIGIYVAFLIMVILVETGVINWGPTSA